MIWFLRSFIWFLRGIFSFLGGYFEIHPNSDLNVLQDKEKVLLQHYIAHVGRLRSSLETSSKTCIPRAFWEPFKTLSRFRLGRLWLRFSYFNISSELYWEREENLGWISMRSRCRFLWEVRWVVAHNERSPTHLERCMGLYQLGFIATHGGRLLILSIDFSLRSDWHAWSL